MLALHSKTRRFQPVALGLGSVGTILSTPFQSPVPPFIHPGAGHGWIYKVISLSRPSALLKSHGSSESEKVRERFCINLWLENIFGLTVVPHVCAWNPVLVESTFYPFPDRIEQPFPMLLSDEGTCFTPKNPDQSPPIRTHPVYIASIPQYIDALLSRHPHLASLPDAPRYAGHNSMETSYLIRYPFLENEVRRKKLLPTLTGRRENVMTYILDRYKRDSKGMLTSRAAKA
jgi:hypothetical protein